MTRPAPGRPPAPPLMCSFIASQLLLLSNEDGVCIPTRCDRARAIAKAAPLRAAPLIATSRYVRLTCVLELSTLKYRLSNFRVILYIGTAILPLRYLITSSIFTSVYC